MKRTMFLVGVLVLSGCSDQDNAKRVLNAAGYTDVVTTGYSLFSCGRDDAVSTGFKAKGPTGTEVKGAVCSGLLFKNSTVRLE